MRFAVIGAGGVGGFFGSKLWKNGEDVCFVARGEHLNAMKRSGLRVNSTEGAFVVPSNRVTETVSEIGPVDVILFCVKSYDTEAAAGKLEPLLKDGTIIISLQNGVENEETIRQHITTGTVFGGVANIYSTITAPGEITETGGPKTLLFGPLQGIGSHSTQGVRAKEILRVLLNAGIRAELSPNIVSDIWKKFVFITAVGGLTALTRLTLGEILAVKETSALMRDAMKETEAIAKTMPVTIEPGLIDSLLEKLRNLDANSRSSLYHDLTHHKPLEIDALSGTVVKLGKQLGIPTPVHSVIFSALLPYHIKHQRTQ
jgi:2-dehydropantoate 2-reductase